MSYKGPHISVRQSFEQNVPGVAIEDLPAFVAATSFNVYENEKIGEFKGANAVTFPWSNITDGKAVFDSSVLGKKGYDFYPVKTTASTPFGVLEIDSTVSSSGVQIAKDETYKLPGTERADGISTATMPLYEQSTAVVVAASDKTILSITNGAAVSSGIVRGQIVYLKKGANDYVYAGVVASNPISEDQIIVDGAPAADTYDKILVGTAFKATLADVNSYANTIYDKTADFIAARVRPGDIVEFIKNDGPTTYTATVTNVINKNTLFFSTENSTDDETNYLEYKSFQSTPGGTTGLTSYSVGRLIGFSQNNGKGGDFTPAAGKYNLVTITPVNGHVPRIGDLVAVVPDNAAAPTVGWNPITGVRPNGGNWDVTLKYANTYDGSALDYYSWTPKQESDINVTFRAVNNSEEQVVTRISKEKDITDAFGAVSPYNELAFMLSAARASAGGRVVYGVNVDVTKGVSEQYSTALDSLKLYDVYSGAFGTTDPGVNALIGPYVDEQSDPYRGHERIGAICYDEDDLTRIGVSTVTLANGGIATLSGLNLIELGVKKGDKVVVSETSEDDVEYEVTSTPTSATTLNISSGTRVITTGGSITIYTGDSSDRAIRISGNAYGNRRITTIFPGWFGATWDGKDINCPPYFISAAIAGFDSSKAASKSFTNMRFSVAGLSNYKLGINRYSIDDLDIIGGAGIDIMVQDGIVDQFIRSRHDLTSDNSSIEFRERSITKQVDVASKTVRAALEPYKGTLNISSETIRFIRELVTTSLSTLKKSGIVKGAEVIDVSRDEEVKDKIIVTIQITVFVAGNYYDVLLNVKS